MSDIWQLQIKSFPFYQTILMIYVCTVVWFIVKRYIDSAILITYNNDNKYTLDSASSLIAPAGALRGVSARNHTNGAKILDLDSTQIVYIRELEY